MTVDTVSAGTCAVMGQPRPVSAILAAVTHRRCFQLAPHGDRWDGVARRLWRIAKRRPDTCYLH
jgi:hypothetical protein